MQDLEFRQLVERVKLHSPIEMIVGERVSALKKQGALHWARCPFHEERTPSFSVDPQRGTWRCWGACGEGGDVVRFVERFDGLSFLDALRLLGRGAGVEIPERLSEFGAGKDEAGFERVLDVISRAEKHYKRNLHSSEGERALAYATSRGFSAETIEAFGIGWASERGNALLDAARASGVEIEALVEAGLVKRNDDGRAYDFFRGRLLVPIADRLGRVVGFGGRILPGDERPQGKYVNTPETRIFHKGRLIFGLDRAAESVRRARHAVFVEGYTDVMAAHQIGVRNVVAVLGSATTDEHAALIKRSGVARITLMFDGDEAGHAATVKSLHGLLPLGFTLDVAQPPAGVDPCELFLERGESGSLELFQAAVDWFAWSLAPLRERRGAQLARGVEDMLALLARLPSPVEADARLLEMSGVLGLSAQSLREEFDRRRGREGRAELVRATQSAVLRDTQSSSGVRDSREHEAAKKIVSALIADNSLIPMYAELLERVPEGSLGRIAQALLDLHETSADGAPVDADQLLAHLGDDPARREVVALVDLARTAESPEALAREEARFLVRMDAERDLTLLEQRLRGESGPASPAHDSSQLLRDLYSQLQKSRVPSRTHVPGAAPP